MYIAVTFVFNKTRHPMIGKSTLLSPLNQTRHPKIGKCTLLSLFFCIQQDKTSNVRKVYIAVSLVLNKTSKDMKVYITVCETILLIATAQLGVIWKTLAFVQFIHKKIASCVMISKYGHHVMLISLIDWFIVLANQSQRSKTWRF